MSASSKQRSEDQFLCYICLAMFKDPVTTPCGHNFCKPCISQHWHGDGTCQCPMCKQAFEIRPHLEVNTLLRDVVVQFRRDAQQEARSSEVQVAETGEVLCDFCTGTKLKALKSCLVCLTSFCQTHLEPHLTLPGLKRHHLMKPVEKLEGRVCGKHDKPLELFCKTDETCICTLCPILDHKNHEIVPLMEGYEEKKEELEKMEANLLRMIQMRRLKIEKLKESMKISKDAANRETAEGVQVFTALMEAAQRHLDQLREEIQDKQKATEKQAEDFIKDLDQEISELTKRSSEVEKIARSDDQLYILQSFSSLKPAPPTKDWTKVRVYPPSFKGTAVRAVSQLEKIIRKEKKKLVVKVEIKNARQYAVDVTLDPETAHPKLVLSDDGKQVYDGNVWKELPKNPKRFTSYTIALGSQSFSSGRFYFEVQVKGKTEWELGVARESISRTEEISACPDEGLWIIWLRNGNVYEGCAYPLVRLHLQSAPEKVGVFVDYEEGLVSFYDVDAAARIFSFTGCWFTEKLYPYFDPCPNDGGKNSAPLIFCPVNQTVSGSSPV